jgi:peptidoglycan/LPS O-acetylase OafA/YrhL
MLSVHRSASRLPSLTGLRCVAALLVFLFHGSAISVFANSTVQGTYAFVTYNAATVGVSFFFVLSGFVLAWSAKSGDTARRFWRRRFFKVFPNHVVAYVVALVLVIATGQAFATYPAVINFFLLQSWLPDSSLVMSSVNPVTWSLSVEMAFYICFPLLIRLVNRIRPSRLWRSAGIVAAVAVLTPVVSMAVLPAGPPSPFVDGTSWFQHWFLYFFPVVRGLEFVSGMILARIVREGRWIGLGVAPAALLTAAVYVASMFLPKPYGFGGLYLVPLTLLVAAAAAADSQGRRSVLNARATVWFGEISFAFFMLHLVILFAVSSVIGPGWAGADLGGSLTGVLLLVGLWAFCTLLAWLLYVLVERPAMRRWARPRHLAPVERLPEPADLNPTTFDDPGTPSETNAAA